MDGYSSTCRTSAKEDTTMLNLPTYSSLLPRVPQQYRRYDQRILWMLATAGGGWNRRQIRFDPLDLDERNRYALAQYQTSGLLTTMPSRDGGQVVELTDKGGEAWNAFVEDRWGDCEDDEDDAADQVCSECLTAVDPLLGDNTAGEFVCHNCSEASCDACGGSPTACNC